jgi:hypothetical protein
MTAAAAFRDAFAFHLRRRRLASGMEGARRGGRRSLWGGLALLLLVVLGVLPPPGGPILTAGLFLAFLAAGTALGIASALRREGTAGGLAAALDGVLRGEGLVPAAAALAERPAAPGRFGTALLERAAEEVAALPPDRVGPLPRPPWRLLGLALLVAVLAALLPAGGFGVLPGFGRGWGSGGRPTTGAPVFGTPGEKKGGTPREAPAGRPSEARPPAAPPKGHGERPVAPPPETVADLSLLPLARTYLEGRSVTLGARAEGGPGAKDGTPLELFVSVDGKPAAGEGVRRRIAAGAREAWAFDLRSFPALLPDLGPGKHRVQGELRDASGAAVARAPEIGIEIEGDGSGGKGGGGGAAPKPEPKPEPKPAPAPQPPEAAAPPPPPKGSPGGKPPAPVLPPSGFEDRVVRPLFGEGASVEKKGKILVLDPEGSRGEAPREVAPEEALAEVRARAESAARREGIDPRDAEAVRRYFEALRRLLEEKK